MKAFTLGRAPLQVTNVKDGNLCDLVEDDGDQGIDLADLPDSNDGEWLHESQLEEDLLDKEEAMNVEESNFCDWVKEDGDHVIVNLGDLPYLNDGRWLHKPQLQDAHRHLLDEEEKVMHLQDRNLADLVEDDGDHGIDLADLPHSDDGEWLHRPQLEDAHWDSLDEEEKACSDRSVSMPSQKPIFSKVFGLGKSGKVSIPATFQATEGSPTACIKADPYILKEAISATVRMQLKCKDEGNLETHYGTAFTVSPTMVLTAGHCLDKKNIVSIKACQERTVMNHNFEEADALDGKVEVVLRQRWSKRSRFGLFVQGADIGLFKISVHFPDFLLPCSPAFLSKKGRKTIAVISFPAVDGFLKEAKKELVKGNNKSTKIWEQYKPTIKAVYEKCLEDMAKVQKISVAKVKADISLVEEADKKVKQALFDELHSTFAVTHTGTMVCSVGSILHMNGVCFGSSYSSLRGSSGAAVVSLERPGEFIGIHHGGSNGYDLNIATSTDSPNFVAMYMDKVLPLLPHPSDQYWSTRDVSGFMHWLHFHATDFIKKTSLWYAVVKKGLKRQRD